MAKTTKKEIRKPPTCEACRQTMEHDARRTEAIVALILEIDDVRCRAPFPRVRALLRRVEDRLREVI